MLWLKICTSKTGLLWPIGYWKTLIDSLTCRGAQNDPREKYEDLANALRPLIEERDGRFFPVSGIATDQVDDSAIGMIEICRTEQGCESIRAGFATPPLSDRWHTDLWRQVRFAYFGTISRAVVEAQTRENRTRLEADAIPRLQYPVSEDLGLSFQITNGRLNRDLDNLVDALIPFFNAHMEPIDRICAVKESPVDADYEMLRYTFDHIPTTIV